MGSQRRASEGGTRIGRSRQIVSWVNSIFHALIFYPGERRRNFLASSAYSSLDSLAAQLVGVQNRKMIVTGHTDATGDSEFNDKQSLRRAEVVADYLRSKLPAETLKTLKITTVGAGEGEPDFENNTAEGRARNRRVTILVD